MEVQWKSCLNARKDSFSTLWCLWSLSFLCGCHDNPLLYRTVAQTLLLWTNELTVDSGLFVQLNFLKYTKCSIGVLFLLFKSKLWAQCDGRRAGILETLETIAFASLWRGRVKRLLTKWKHQFHSNVFLNAKYSSFLPLWRTSFYSECCHKNKLLLFSSFQDIVIKINSRDANFVLSSVHKVKFVSVFQQL